MREEWCSSIALCVIGKVLTPKSFSIISRISLLVILLVFVLFYAEAVKDSSLIGIYLTKFPAAYDFGKDFGMFWSWNVPIVSQRATTSASYVMENAKK